MKHEHLQKGVSQGLTYVDAQPLYDTHYKSKYSLKKNSFSQKLVIHDFNMKIVSDIVMFDIIEVVVDNFIKDGRVEVSCR